MKQNKFQFLKTIKAIWKKIKALMKIHRQFGNAQSDNMKQLSKQRDFLHNDILSLNDEVYDTCKTCKQ